ncbi:MAG: hypothetical protein EAZ37_15205 [Burkholderiales bacterium]|nr:MAG: hypothetical protein EAZ43_10475 [Betaproteobacteria bacterium]TAG24790.1 MAG: hypothetical protein EAZ37_15205 [Burkholderiales bacterium]
MRHSRIVKAWQQVNAEKVKLFYRPSYSPQMNSNERLNADQKHAIETLVPVRTQAMLREATEVDIQRIQ